MFKPHQRKHFAWQLCTNWGFWC